MSDLINRADAIDAVINLWADKPFGQPALIEIKECIENLPSAERAGIPIEWLEEKLTNHPELPYAVTDGIIAVLELWNNECGARMEGEEE